MGAAAGGGGTGDRGGRVRRRRRRGVAGSARHGRRQARGRAARRGPQGRRADRHQLGRRRLRRPGQTYYQFGYMVHFAVNRGLYSYKPGRRREAVGRPRHRRAGDLGRPPHDHRAAAPRRALRAARRPRGHRGRRQVRLRARVQRQCRAEPVRDDLLRDIVGAPTSRRRSARRTSPGSTTPDDRTIVFKLRTPSRRSSARRWRCRSRRRCPRSTRSQFDAKTPSTYDGHVAFTGPYMIRNTRRRRARRAPAGAAHRARAQPQLGRATDYRPAYLDTITVEEGNDDATVAARRILNGRGLVQGDGATPASVLAARRRAHARAGRARPRRPVPDGVDEHARSSRSTTSTCARR